MSRAEIDTAINWDKIKEKYFREEIPYILNGEELTLNRETIAAETLKDPLLRKVLKNIKENWLEVEKEESEEFEIIYKLRNELYIEGNVIIKGISQILIPTSLRQQILKLLHKAHFGIERTKSRGRKFVWWPNFGKDVELYISACQICQTNAHKPPKLDPKHKWPQAKLPMERLHADLAGPIWNTNFLIVVDVYTKYIWVTQLTSTNSHVIINALTNIFSMFGNPVSIVTDNGSQFCSVEIENFLFEEGISHVKSPIYHPSSNGIAEKAVQTFKRGMKKLLEEKHDMKKAIQILLKEYRASPLPHIGESPSALMFKREMRTQIDKLRIKQTTLQNKQRQHLSRKIPAPFALGDLVWVYIKKAWSPGVITQLLGDRMCSVEVEGEEKQIHLDHIKPRRKSSRERLPYTHFD